MGSAREASPEMPAGDGLMSGRAPVIELSEHTPMDAPYEVQVKEPRKLRYEHSMFGERFVLCGAGIELFLMVLFSTITDYETASKTSPQNNVTNMDNTVTKAQQLVTTQYNFYQDMTVMIFIGFGFLMAFLKKHGFCSVGFNFFLGAFVMQWAAIMVNLMHYTFDDNTTSSTLPMKMDIQMLVNTQFCAIAV